MVTTCGILGFILKKRSQWRNLSAIRRERLPSGKGLSFSKSYKNCVYKPHIFTRRENQWVNSNDSVPVLNIWLTSLKSVPPNLFDRFTSVGEKFILDHLNNGIRVSKSQFSLWEGKKYLMLNYLQKYSLSSLIYQLGLKKCRQIVKFQDL